ncbi:hypothetical protein VTK26DRAFT_3564 [Humicola hyalothermophila]
MGSAYAAYHNGTATANGIKGNSSPYTVTAMSRWSILDKQLPAVETIKAIHVYDFDNTLFKTPLPNPKIWNGPTIGTLSNPDAFVNGGWWHDSRILAATGEGLAKEEPRAWEGWWNDKIVELIGLSMQQKDALCVLLTGRSESGFGDLIKRMVTSKGLEFDLISLKPAVGPSNERFASTMIFKQMFLQALMETYREAEEIRIYEDRIKHVKGFRDFLEDYNLKKKMGGVDGSPVTRGPINGEVIQVADIATYLDPVVEVAEVQQIINDHNAALSKRRRGTRGERLAIRKTVFYTGYMISNADTQRLLKLAQIPQSVPEGELKFHANNIMICPRPCPPSILEKIGGLGSKMTWEVTGTACFENTIWAARVKPVPASAKFHSGDPVPLVVLALRKGARHVDAGKIQTWQALPADVPPVRFETTVGEKILLRIEAEDARASPLSHGKSGAGNAAAGGGKRKHTAAADDFRSRHNSGGGGGGGGGGGIHHQYQQSHQQKQFHHQPGFAGGRGGSNKGGFRGGGGGGGGFSRGFKHQRGGGGGGAKGRGGGGGGRGGGGGGHYRSLDDVGTRDSNQGGFAQMYEDEPQNTQGQQQQQQQQQQQNIPTGPASMTGGAGPGPGYHSGGGGVGAGGGPGLGNFY